jgi:hypothetical protein
MKAKMSKVSVKGFKRLVDDLYNHLLHEIKFANVKKKADTTPEVIKFKGVFYTRMG